MTHLPRGWTEVALGDVCEVNPKPRLVPDTDDDVAFLGMSSVHADGTTDEGELRRFGDVSKGYTQFERGDVLVAKITPCFENGKIAQAGPLTPVATGSTEFHVVRARENVDARYILHYLRQPRVRVEGERRMTGSGGQRRVPASFVATLPLPLPPLEEQRRIAAILDKADELRAKRRAALEQLDSLTQAIFLDMFGDPVENQGGWARSTLGALLESIDSGQSPVCMKEPAPFGEWGVLKLGAVSFGRFDPSENKRLPEETPPESRHEVRSGDVLFSRKNTSQLVAACVYVDDTPPRLLLSDLIFRLRISDDAGVLPRYLVSALQSPRMKRAVQSLATGAAASMPNISKQKLMEVSLPVPDLESQRRFDEVCELIDKTRNDLNRGEQETQSLLVSLQSRAFRGEL